MLKNLKVLREEVGVSQKYLADIIGVSQQSINKYENHNIEPDISTLIKIADFFDTSVDYIIGHTDVRRKIEKVHTFQLNESESNMLKGFRKLNKRQKDCVLYVISSYNLQS